MFLLQTTFQYVLHVSNMDKRSENIIQLTLHVPADAMDGFTTLLQNGIEIDVKPATSVGELLASLNGFTPQYIAERVETIFLNGFPVDNPAMLISGSHPVLAISAAMPGLAGAIFRKNSFHAPLRTSCGKNDEKKKQANGTIPVSLKLFNMVAKEKGEALLAGGCLFNTEALLKTIRYRPQLFTQVLQCTCNNRTITMDYLPYCLIGENRILLKVQTARSS